MEAGQDHLQLPGIPVDIADGEDARLGRLELLGIRRDQVLVQVQAELGDRTQLHRQSVEGEQRVAFDLEDAVRSLERHCLQLPAAAVQRRDLGDAIGRASCRERVCQYVYISVVAVSLKKQTHIKHKI